MNGSVLFPVTDQTTSKRAIPFASSLAVLLNTPLHLLHVHYSTAPFSPGPAAAVDVLDARVRAVELGGLQQIAREARRLGVDSVDVTMLDGIAADTICQFSRHIHALYLVLNARPTANAHLAWRGIVERVTMESHLPTFVLPAQAQTPRGDFQIRRILVPLDGTPRGEEILGPVVEVARAANAEVLLLHVFRKGSYPHGFVDSCMLDATDTDRSDRHCVDRYLETTVARLRRHDINATAVVVQGADVAGTIRNEAQRCGADLIAMSWQAPSSAIPIVAARSVLALLRRGPLPMLLCNAPIARCTPLSTEIEQELAAR